MLSDKIRLLEDAVDRAQAAEAEVNRVKDVTRGTLEKAGAEYQAIQAACASAVGKAIGVQQAALKDVDRYKAEVRGFIDDIMQVGRVRQ